MVGVTSNLPGRKNPGLVESQVVRVPSEMTIGGDTGGHAQAPPRGAKDENVSPAPMTLDSKYRIRGGAGIISGDTETLVGRVGPGLSRTKGASGPPGATHRGRQKRAYTGATARRGGHTFKPRLLNPVPDFRVRKNARSKVGET